MTNENAHLYKTVPEATRTQHVKHLFSSKYTSVKDSYFSFFPPLNDAYDPYSLPLSCNEFLSTWMCVTVQNQENRSFCLWLAKMPPRLLCPCLIAAVRLRLQQKERQKMHNRPVNVHTKRNVGSATISMLIFSTLWNIHNLLICNVDILWWSGAMAFCLSVCSWLECRQLRQIGKVVFVASWLKYPLRSLGVSHQKDVSVLSVQSERLVFVSVCLNVDWKTSCTFKIATLCFPAKVTQHIWCSCLHTQIHTC